MPPDAYKILSGQMANIMQQSKGGLLTFGAIATLWSASSGVTSVMDGLNRAYDVEDKRSIIKKRALSLGITLGLALLTVLGAAILVGSDKIATILQHWTGLSAIATIGSIVGAVLGLVFMFAGLEVVYYFGPNVKDQKWSWISPGSLVGVIIFLAVSFVFSLYLRLSNTYNATYGNIGGIIILMLWLYYLGVAILAGGEVNAIIAQAAREKGNKQAPKYGVEEEKTRENIKSTSKPKDGTSKSEKNGDKATPMKSPSPAPYYAFDEERLSRQAQKRMALRRLVRHERFQRSSEQHTAGWTILKRPVAAAVYLGSIGFFMASAIMKHLQKEGPAEQGADAIDVDRALRASHPTQVAKSPQQATVETRALQPETREAAYRHR
jgi:membrane protein